MATTSASLPATAAPPQRKRANWLPAVMTLPATLALIGIMYPFAIAVYYSFTNYRIVSPTFEFIGFRNYGRMFTNPDFWESMGNTLLFAGVALVVELTLGFLILAPCAVLALYPPTGFDATHYHLPFVKSFIAAQRLLFLPDLRVPVFPVAVEMDFVLAFFLSGDVAAQLTQLLAMLATAGLVFAWGRRGFSRRAGLWAAALWLGVPLVVFLGASAYVKRRGTRPVMAAP